MTFVYALLLALSVLLVTLSVRRQRKRKRDAPRPTRAERWLGIQSDIGLLIVAVAMVVGFVPFIFSVTYLIDRTAGTRRDSEIVIAVIGFMLLFGWAIHRNAAVKLRRIRAERASRQ